MNAKSWRLTNFTLQPLAADVGSTTIQPLDSNTRAAGLIQNPALQVSATRTLAQLGFLAEGRNENTMF